MYEYVVRSSGLEGGAASRVVPSITVRPELYSTLTARTHDMEHLGDNYVWCSLEHITLVYEYVAGSPGLEGGAAARVVPSTRTVIPELCSTLTAHTHDRGHLGDNSVWCSLEHINPGV